MIVRSGYCSLHRDARDPEEGCLKCHQANVLVVEVPRDLKAIADKVLELEQLGYVLQDDISFVSLGFSKPSNETVDCFARGCPQAGSIHTHG